MSETSTSSWRIASIDQLRGFAILGMIFVNTMNHFAAVPWLLHHHREGMSINDTIAPLFIFVVGMGFRLSFLRHVKREGYVPAARRAARRYLTLAAIGVPFYWGYWWDALTDIGLAGLLALPVMHRTAWARGAWGVGALVLFQVIFTFTPYGDWGRSNSINGGPLGPLAWCFILMNGTLAWEVMRGGDGRRIVAACLTMGALLVVAGYALSLPWVEMKEAWPLSQYYMTAPYPLVSTGLCWWALLLFHGVCDRAGVRIPGLALLGRNPLVLYLIQLVLVGIMQATVSGGAGWPVIIACFFGIYAVCHAAAWVMDRREIIVKL